MQSEDILLFTHNKISAETWEEMKETCFDIIIGLSGSGKKGIVGELCGSHPDGVIREPTY